MIATPRVQPGHSRVTVQSNVNVTARAETGPPGRWWNATACADETPPHRPRSRRCERGRTMCGMTDAQPGSRPEGIGALGESRPAGVGDGRNESPLERLDRNWNEILQELRVTQTGIQILTGFLL